MSTRRTAVRLAAALAVVPPALAGCGGSVDGDGVEVEVDTPDVDVPDVPGVEVTTTWRVS